MARFQFPFILVLRIDLCTDYTRIVFHHHDNATRERAGAEHSTRNKLHQFAKELQPRPAKKARP
jgi:hypothetical protein